MSHANTNTPILHEPRYIGANSLGVHKVAIGDQIARFWTEAEAREGMQKLEQMRKQI